jgi:hypothetical protein
MVSIDFGESELSDSPSRLKFLTDFVDKAMGTNARNWEERKKFLSHFPPHEEGPLSQG